MQNKPLPSGISAPAEIPLNDLVRHAEGWFLTGEIDQHSAGTIAFRRAAVGRLVAFLRARDADRVDTHALRLFLHYLTIGHKEPGGRWGNPRLTNPVRPSTVQTYHNHLRTFFRWLVNEGLMPASPMDRIPAPVVRTDQVQPFTPDQIDRLLDAAKKSRYPRRDTAVIYFLLDTGLRASEVIRIRIGDLDTVARRVTVVGKGNKKRTVNYHKTTAHAIHMMLRDKHVDERDPLFQNERNREFTRSGLLQLIERLGDAAGIDTVRCSPHTFRHTFAVEFLRAGGNQFTLKEILGHTDLKMTNRYVQLAQADVDRQHAAFSPVEHLRRQKG